MPFKCLPDCGECCTMIPLDKRLFTTHRHNAQVNPIEVHELEDGEVLPQTKDGLCVFLDRLTKQCAIYTHRPQVCKLFGTSKEVRLQCPYLHPSGKRRSRASRRQIQRNTANRITKLLSIENP